jgi:hypothetical protein
VVGQLACREALHTVRPSGFMSQNSSASPFTGFTAMPPLEAQGPGGGKGGWEAV